MKPDEPPGQDHRRHVEQFIGKRPPERTQGQLEHIGRNRDGEGEPDALSRENRGREYALEYFRHLGKRTASSGIPRCLQVSLQDRFSSGRPASSLQVQMKSARSANAITENESNPPYPWCREHRTLNRREVA